MLSASKLASWSGHAPLDSADPVHHELEKGYDMQYTSVAVKSGTSDSVSAQARTGAIAAAPALPVISHIVRHLLRAAGHCRTAIVSSQPWSFSRCLTPSEAFPAIQRGPL